MKKFAGFLIACAALAVPAVSLAAGNSVAITLSGGTVTVQQGQPFVEPGFSAFSTVDGDVTGSVFASTVSTLTPGNTERFYSVTDSALDFASASRDVVVVGGGNGMVFCSSPLAPGFNVSLPGGGCGSTTWIAQGKQLPDGSTCTFQSGCMLPKQ